MTLTEYETTVAALPGFQRFVAAAPIVKLRELVASGETFTAARDRIVTQRQYHEPLSETGQLSTFAALTGP